MTAFALAFLGGFLLGSVPFAVVCGYLIAKKDIREAHEDRNPGAGNAFRAGGLKAGVPALVLEVGKGFLPVWLAREAGLGGYQLALVALAPALGHAFTPFLKFRGGKSIAASFGAWIALSPLWAFVLALGMGIFYSFMRADAWVVLLGYLFQGALLALFGTGPQLLLWFLNGSLVAWKHRRELKKPIEFRFSRAG